MKTKLNLLLCFLLAAAVACTQNDEPASLNANTKSQSQNANGKQFISKDKLININSIDEIMKICNYENVLPVVGFKMTAVRKNIDPNEVQSESNLINAEMKSIIAMVETGSKIYFEYIKAQGEDGKLKNLPPINIEIE